MMTFARVAMVVVGLLSGSALGADVLANVKTQADLDAVIASTSDAGVKGAIRENSAAILAAAGRRPHVLAVIQTVESSPGKLVKANLTPPGLKKALGGDVGLFDTLTGVDLSIPNAGPHDARKVDPYDAAFFEHLGHVDTLESLYVIATKLNDDWIAPLGGLTNLKMLSFVNNGKLTDAGLERLAGLSQLESFSFVGTGMKGHAFAKFEGWTKVKRASFRGSSLDDEGLRLLCEHLNSLDSLSLAHAHFTDAGSVHLRKLTNLKGLEVGSRNATPECLRNVVKLPLSYLQLGDGLDAPAGIAIIKDIATLRRLTITNAKAMTDADVKVVAGMTQLESLEFSDLELTDERVGLMQGFSFLKALRLVHRPKYPEEMQAKIKGMLPKVALRFD